MQLAKQASCNDAVRPNPPVQIGEVISDHTLSQRCSSQIYQAEFGRDLKLSEEGLVALTRNPGEVVRDEFRGQDILIGTYSFNGNRLAMFIRKINSTSGVISKMVSKEVVYNCGFMGTMAKIIK